MRIVKGPDKLKDDFTAARAVIHSRLREIAEIAGIELAQQWVEVSDRIAALRYDIARMRRDNAQKRKTIEYQETQIKEFGETVDLLASNNLSEIEEKIKSAFNGQVRAVQE